jgi:protoporphyrinogen oxidase
MAARKVAVIGAGIAGLTAAYELSKAGVEVEVFEQRDQIGGLARGVLAGEAELERYYHFICGGDHALMGLARELGIGERIHWAPAPTSYYVNGRLYPFSTALDIMGFGALPLTSRVRLGLHAARAGRFTDWPAIENQTAEEWLVAGMGRQAYEAVWEPLLRMKFGSRSRAISAAWMWHRIWRVGTSRKSLLRPDEMGYFEGGSLTLLRSLAGRIEAAGGAIHLGRPVRALRNEGRRITGVVTDAGDVAVDAVISTAPLPAVVPLLPAEGADFAQALGGVGFVGVVCLLLVLGKNPTECFWVNVNDAGIPFNGFVEYTNLNPWPEGQARALYIPLYMPSDDPRFVLPDGELSDMMLSGLEAMFPGFSRGQVRQCLVTRDDYAQAVCPPGFSRQVPPLAAPLPGLYLTDSTQLYPADRNLSGTIELARSAVKLCLEQP